MYPVRKKCRNINRGEYTFCVLWSTMFEETIRSHRGVRREVLSDPRLRHRSARWLQGCIYTGIRPLGGAILALCGAVAYKNWKRKAGAGRATFLTAVYLARSAPLIRSPRSLARGLQSTP